MVRIRPLTALMVHKDVFKDYLYDIQNYEIWHKFDDPNEEEFRIQLEDIPEDTLASWALFFKRSLLEYDYLIIYN